MNAFMFRRFNGEDVEGLYAALKDPRVVRHMASAGITMDDCRAIVKGSTEHWDEHGIGSWAVWGDSKILGWAGFKLWRQGEFEILIVLSPEAWGVGRSVFRELMNLAPKRYALNRVFVLLPETRRSFVAMNKLGFVFCGNELFNNQPFLKFVYSFEGQF